MRNLIRACLASTTLFGLAPSVAAQSVQADFDKLQAAISSADELQIEALSQDIVEGENLSPMSARQLLGLLKGCSIAKITPPRGHPGMLGFLDYDCPSRVPSAPCRSGNFVLWANFSAAGELDLTLVEKRRLEKEECLPHPPPPPSVPRGAN